jgi:predicted heme/steroid binding protein
VTRKELAENDGREGRKAYVAVNGNIYDFTDSQMWQNGDHQGVHQAGRDLTEELKNAPHVRAVIERFPVVGQLEEEAAPASKPGGKIVAAVLAIIILIVVIALFI